jgi:hypothetical protein
VPAKPAKPVEPPGVPFQIPPPVDDNGVHPGDTQDGGPPDAGPPPPDGGGRAATAPPSSGTRSEHPIKENDR